MIVQIKTEEGYKGGQESARRHLKQVKDSRVKACNFLNDHLHLVRSDDWKLEK